MNDLTIINKMINELQTAKEKAASRQELMPHIRHVKLLSELFLEDESPSQKVQENTSFNEQEIKAMLGKKAHQSQQSTKTQQTKFEDDDANGDSIFDF